MSAEALVLACDLARRFEGLYDLQDDGLLRPYLCPAGVLTIGYGHTGPDVGPEITVLQAEKLLTIDMSAAVGAALKLSPSLAENTGALAAIADFIFNCGATAYRGSTLRRRIDIGAFDDAGAELLKWVYAKGRRLPGLMKRRLAEAALLKGAGV